MTQPLPEFILFAQHGMTDTNYTLSWFAESLAPDRALVVAPNLGYFKTLWYIEPLVAHVEQTATETLHQYPHLPLRIVATSLGGVIWLEVLHRHPEWWPRIHSLVLLGAPIGGSDLARMVDPFGWGIGAAQGLGINRRALAERIAAVIPTLIIAGNIGGGTDRTVTLESTKFRYAHFVSVAGVNHPALRHHPAVAAAIREFWAVPRSPLPPADNLTERLIQQLYAVPGMTDGHWHNFHRAQTWLQYQDGTQIRRWKNPIGVEHVFIGDHQGNCAYSGFVGWVHTSELNQALALIKQDFAHSMAPP
jgi:pimeloyl-ACP methyl ester carboxylesterase